jgi:hypothetical protein
MNSNQREINSYREKMLLKLLMENYLKNFFVQILKTNQLYQINKLKGVGVVIWYLSITPQNKSRAAVKILRILVCRSSLRLTITHLKVNLVTSHHQVVSLF